MGNSFLCCAEAAISSLDYAILSSVLSHGLGEACNDVVVEEKTYAGSVALSNGARTLASSAEQLGLDVTLLSAWETKNRQFDYIEEKFELPCKIQVLSAQQRAEIFANQQANELTSNWQDFRRRFPKAAGIMRLSKPVIDVTGERALAYVEFDCGSSCGSGRFITLEKRAENSWQVSGGSLVWIATEE